MTSMTIALLNTVILTRSLLRFSPFGCVCRYARRPACIDIWLTNFPSFQTGIRFSYNFFLISRRLKFNCLAFVHHFLLNSCSALFGVLSNSNTTWASFSASILVQNVLAQVQPFLTFATCQLILLLDCWPLMRVLSCRIPRTANTQIQELQKEFIGVVKLADKKSSHPSHVHLGSIL